MLGWVILVAALIPAIALGRWAERERRRTTVHRDVDPPIPPSRPTSYRSRRTRRASDWAAQPARRTSARRSRTYAGR
jgi:hypothetical protein